MNDPSPSAAPVALYDQMCRAIDDAYTVDEVKHIRDKAIAWEVYSRQARNVEAERRACSIRLRAEKKAGQLDKQREKAKGGRPSKTPSTEKGVSTPTLADLGVSPKQAHDWRKLADVPDDQFEAALNDPTRKPTTAGIIRDATPPDPIRVPVSHDALWVWGRLLDFERDGILAKPVADVLLTMTPQMLNDVLRLAPRVSVWLGTIGRSQCLEAVDDLTIADFAMSSRA
jgi:hypothetical protein